MGEIWYDIAHDTLMLYQFPILEWSLKQWSLSPDFHEEVAAHLKGQFFYIGEF